MTQRIDDVIILGRGVPEQISGGRITVCVAGFSPSMGFVRLYPTRIDSPLRQWSVVSVEVERNPQDSRAESWKFPDSRSGWENINQHIQPKGDYPKDARLALMDEIKSSCVNEVNERRQSLGIIRPNIQRVYLAENQMHSQAYQPLFEIMEHAEVATKRDHYFEPRIEYICGCNCRSKAKHNQQLLEWGCYQWMKSNPGKEQQIWRNLHIGDCAWTHYFLIGNQANHRTAFMVINVIRQKATMIQSALLKI